MVLSIGGRWNYLNVQCSNQNVHFCFLFRNSFLQKTIFISCKILKSDFIFVCLEKMTVCFGCLRCSRWRNIQAAILLTISVIIFPEESKLKYYNLMIQVDQHEGSYLSICKHYRAIYDTPCILEDSSKWQQVSTGLRRLFLFFRLQLYLFCFRKKYCSCSRT